MKIFKNKKSTCRDSRSEIKQLRREVRKRETVAVREVLTNANVVLSTLTSASVHTPLKHLNDGHFDLIIIDECSQVSSCLTSLICVFVKLSQFIDLCVCVCETMS